MTDKLCCPKCGRLLRVVMIDREYMGVAMEKLERNWCDTCRIFIDDDLALVKDTDGTLLPEAK